MKCQHEYSQPEKPVDNTGYPGQIHDSHIDGSGKPVISGVFAQINPGQHTYRQGDDNGPQHQVEGSQYSREDSTSFAGIVLKPAVNYQSKTAHKFGLYGTGEAKRYKIQKSGYEDFNKLLYGGTYSFLGDYLDLDADYFRSAKAFIDSSEKNYKLNELSLNGRMFIGEGASLELFWSREKLVYINNPLGQDWEVTGLVEATLSIFSIKDLDINLMFTREKINYTQHDSVTDDLSMEKIFQTDYNSVRFALEPDISFSLSDNISLDGYLKGELLRVKIPAIETRTDSIRRQYFIPKEDDYNSSGWKVAASYQKDRTSGSLGLEYEVIRYVEGQQYDYSDFKSLRINADAEYPVTSRLLLHFSADWPLPGMEGQNTVEDKSVSGEMEYAF